MVKLLLKKSGWSKQHLESYLNSTVSPLRIACIDSNGYPVIVPLWFHWDGKCFWCVTHHQAKLVKYLQRNNRIGFEVANNTPPYHGVRGQGEVELISERGAEWVEQLLSRYLPGVENRFTRWLLGRKDQEVAIKIYPYTLSAWDYKKRMSLEEGE